MHSLASVFAIAPMVLLVNCVGYMLFFSESS